MIFSIKKALYKEKVDFCITPVGEAFKIFVTSVRGGYYLFNEHKEQIGQLIFNGNDVELCASDSSAIILTRTTDGFEVKNRRFSPDEEKEVEAKDKQRTRPAKFFITGDFYDYFFTVYEKVKKIPDVVARIIPDAADESYYRVRIEGGSNTLKILMIIIAIDRIIQEELDQND